MDRVAARARSLVIAMSRRNASTGADDLAEPELRTAFLKCAERLRVPGLVLARLERTRGAERLPPPAWAELHDALRRLRGAAALLDLERDRVLALLQRAGVNPVVLKGGGLRCTLYSEPAERQVGDLDLLIPEEEVDGALGVLIRGGYQNLPEHLAAAYRRHHFHVRLSHPAGYVTEIHWALAEPHRPFGLDPAALLRQSRLARRSPVPLRTPCDEHQLLHLVLQNALDRFLWFNRLVDVDRLAASGALDWEFIEHEARRPRLLVPLALTCELSRRILNTKIPREALRILRPSTAVRVHIGLLAPHNRMLAPDLPRPATADWLLDIWLLPSAWLRAVALAKLSTRDGFVDPRHLAMGTAARPGLMPRLLAPLKVMAYQLLLYVTGATVFLTRRRPDYGRLWSAQARQEHPEEGTHRGD
jgi:hypothetical protein